MKRLGIIGYPLSHSFSLSFFYNYFREKNIKNTNYDLFPLKTISDFPKLIEQMPNLIGLNVTIPYKESILNYLDEISNDAQSIGAVNTVLIKKQGRKKILCGYNTDVIGFEKSLTPLLTKKIDKGLVLGTGGAAKAVCFVLKKMNISYLLATSKQQDLQTNEIAYSSLNKVLVKDSKLIVNTTPLGMFPNMNTCPNIPYEVLGSEHLLYDLVYNPRKTLFLQQGEVQSAKIKNGLEMLEIQAKASWNIWNTNSI